MKPTTDLYSREKQSLKRYGSEHEDTNMGFSAYGVPYLQPRNLAEE
jgi:hypothetical protein